MSGLHGIEVAWLVMAGIGVAFFLDAPRLTMRQSFQVRQSRPRLVLLIVESALVLLWAVSVFVLRIDGRIVPPAWMSGVTGAGIALTAFGVALAVWAKLRLGRWFSATFGVKEGHELVTDGPYGVTRHPIYTGLLTAIIGGALVFNSGITLILAGALVVPFFLHTVYEEAMFEKHFGQAYFDYERRVPRLVPLPRPRR